MNKMKYVMFYDGTFIIFHEGFSHVEFSNMKEIISGGFIQFYEENGGVKPCCFGESISLKLKSRESVDEEIIYRYMRGY